MASKDKIFIVKPTSNTIKYYYGLAIAYSLLIGIPIGLFTYSIFVKTFILKADLITAIMLWMLAISSLYLIARLIHLRNNYIQLSDKGLECKVCNIICNKWDKTLSATWDEIESIEFKWGSRNSRIMVINSKKTQQRLSVCLSRITLESCIGTESAIKSRAIKYMKRSHPLCYKNMVKTD